MHRTLDGFSTIIVIGYSMPEYDGYAYEALGRLLIRYQTGGERTYWEQRRVPLQVVDLASSEKEVFERTPFLQSDSARIWVDGFDRDSLSWLDWGDGGATR